MQKKVMIGILIFLFFVLTVFLLFYFLKPEVPILGGEATQPEGTTNILKEPKIAPIKSREQEFTTTEIFSKAAEEGMAFCDKLEDKYLIEPCKHEYTLNKVVETKNPDVCEELKGEGYIKDCKIESIITLVAVAYKEESEAKGDGNITPSNIGLCDQLSGGDKELCQNPKKVIDKIYYNTIITGLKYGS